MLEAALRGKPLGIEAEDALTATVFGLLRYLPCRVLRKWIQSANPVDQAVPLRLEEADISIEFWPSLPDTFRGAGRVEPDVLLTIGSVTYVVEAKLNSPQGEDQLAREWKSVWDWCSTEQRGQRTLGGLLYTTAHLAMPRADFNRALAALKDKPYLSPLFYWLPWSTLCAHLDEDIKRTYSAVVTDLSRYLGKTRLLRFDGWPPIDLNNTIWGYAGSRTQPYWEAVTPRPNYSWFYQPSTPEIKTTLTGSREDSQ
jgi:hypothetical protein